jgi:type I restriction enzyme, S subunit
MKNGLPIKPLQSLCDDFKQDIVDGPFGSELQRKDYITEGVPVLKIQNVKPFAIELKKMDYVSPDKFQELRRHSYRRGDIVMTKLGNPLGVSAIVQDLDEGVIVADLVRIRAQRINTKYLCYHLNSQRTNDFINSMQKGTTRPRVTLSVVRELPIFVPTLSEQQRIVSILDEVFAGIATAKANAEKNLENAHALFEGHLQSVFKRQPDEVPLSALATDVTDGDHMPPPKASAGVPFITISDIVKHTRQIDFSNTFTVPMEYFRKLKPNKKPRVGDVLYTVTGATLGIPVLVGEQRDFCFQRHIGLVRPKPDTDSAWLTYALLSPQVFRQATIGSTGAAQKTVSLSALRDLKLPKLSFAEQKCIAAQLDAISAETERLARLYERKLAALEALKRSLLHQAFTGEL